MSREPAVTAAREAFPTGLHQPDGGYRFSLDALLLASFVALKKNDRMADLGAGCGVAGLAALLRGERESSGDPAMTTLRREVVSLDIDPAMTRAAGKNSVHLGFADCLTARTLDIRHIRDEIAPESFTVALANPPYRKQGTGLPCRGEERAGARSEAHASLNDFIAAASWLLTNRGRLAVVFPADRLSELLAGCELARLTPKRLRLVHSRLNEPGRLVLLEAVKNAGSGLSIEAPLVLYERLGPATRLRPAALAFCPFLERNP